MNQNIIPHIVVIAPYFYPKIGGVENYAYLLAKHLQESKEYRVSVITSNYDGAGYKREIIDGMTVHRLPISFKISNTPINLAWYRQVKDILTKDMPDILHIHAPVAFLPDVAARVASAQKIPFVLTYHSGSMLKDKWPIDIIIGLYEKIFLGALFKQATMIVAISRDFATRTFPQYIYKTSFIPSGVELDRFKKTPLPSESEVVTYVGRIERHSRWKGIEQLLGAFVIVLKQRPNAQLELVGGGDALEEYQARAVELGIRESVIFTGPQTGQELVEAYERAQVVVLASTSDSESFGITLIEAQASGRPVIGTRIGGIPQAIEDGKNGLLVPAKDTYALAMALVRVLSDKTLAQNFADYGAQNAQEFSWDIQTKKYSDLFEKILTKR